MPPDDSAAADISLQITELRKELRRKYTGIAPDAVMRKGGDKAGILQIKAYQCFHGFSPQQRLISRHEQDRAAFFPKRFRSQPDRTARPPFRVLIPDGRKPKAPRKRLPRAVSYDRAYGGEPLGRHGLQRALEERLSPKYSGQFIPAEAIGKTRRHYNAAYRRPP